MTIKMWSKNQAASGFTLLEMLIAITIVASVVTVIGTSFPSVKKKKDLVETAARLDATLSEARTAALKNAKTTSVVFDLDKRQWRSSTQEFWQIWPETIEMSLVTARELGGELVSSVIFLSDGTSSGAIIQMSSTSATTVVRRVHWLTGAIHVE